MASYAKIWTDIFDDDWFLSLNCNHRGFWLQLIIAAKMLGDCGKIVCKSAAFLSHICGLDYRTTVSILEKFKMQGKLIVEKSEFGSMVVTIPNYQYWQQLRNAKLSVQEKPDSDNNATKLSQISTKTKPNQTITKPNNISAKKKRTIPDTDHAKFIDYFFTKHKERFDRKYDFKKGKDGKHVSDLLKVYKIDILLQMVDIFFDEDDEFLIKAGYTIGVFRSQSNKLAQKQSGNMPTIQPIGRAPVEWKDPDA